MRVFVVWDPLYERALGAYSTEEAASSECDRLLSLDKDPRTAYFFEVAEFEIDAPAIPMRVN